jgi:putative flippase GtrA
MMPAGMPVFGRYLLVGLAATAVHYALLLALVEFAGAAAAPAAAFGAACGALAAYAGNRSFTFKAGAAHRQALPRFLAVAACGSAGNGAIVWAGTEVLGMHYMAAQVIATAIVVWSGFALNRNWSFA